MEKDTKYQSIGDSTADLTNSRVEVARSNVQKQQWFWYEIDEFLRGNHYMAFNAATNQITNAVPAYLRQAPSTRIAVDLTLAAYKTLTGFITRGDKGVVVIPIDEKGSDNAQLLSKDLSAYAYYLNRHLRLPQKVQEVTQFGLRRSVGIAKVYWDDDADNGEGCQRVDTVDPYDMLWDPTATYPDRRHCGYMIHAIRKTIKSLEESGYYDPQKVKLVTPDNYVSVSNAKTMELQEAYPTIANSSTSIQLPTVIVYEVYEPRKNGKKWEIWKACVAGNVTIKDWEKTEFDDYPFVFYWTDRHPQEMLGEGAMKPLIPINRVIDRIESQIAEYHNIFLKGSYKTEKGSGVKVFTNQNGKIFMLNKGFDFEQLPMQEMAASIFKQLENWISYHQTVSGVNQAMVGEKPKGTRTGVEIEALQEAGSNNLQQYISNMNYFMEELYLKLFKLASKHYTTIRTHPVGNLFNNQQLKQYVGPKGIGAKKKNVVIIPDNIHITVSVDNLIGYTQTERFNRIMQLSGAQGGQQILDRQAVLEMLAVTGFQDIVARQETREQQKIMQEHQMEMQQTAMEQQAKSLPAAPKVNINVRAEANPLQAGEILESQGIAANPGLPQDVQSAMYENQHLANGVSVPPTPNASPHHTLTHLDYMHSDAFKQLPATADSAFMQHVLGESQAQQEQQKQAMLQQMALMAMQSQEKGKGGKQAPVAAPPAPPMPPAPPQAQMQAPS